jgi:hypothetical protein
MLYLCFRFRYATPCPVSPALLLLDAYRGT